MRDPPLRTRRRAASRLGKTVNRATYRTPTETAAPAAITPRTMRDIEPRSDRREVLPLNWSQHRDAPAAEQAMTEAKRRS
jgi:hypothetical protein